MHFRNIEVNSLRPYMHLAIVLALDGLHIADETFHRLTDSDRRMRKKFRFRLRALLRPKRDCRFLKVHPVERARCGVDDFVERLHIHVLSVELERHGSDADDCRIGTTAECFKVECYIYNFLSHIIVYYM